MSDHMHADDQRVSTAADTLAKDVRSGEQPCRLCTVPTADGVCGFCQGYQPPAEEWTDLKDQLTEDQIQLVEYTESLNSGDPRLINLARVYAAENKLQRDFAHVPLPDGAVTAGDWINDGAAIYRVTHAARRGEVELIGMQSPDATVTWEVCLGDEVYDHDAAQELAGHLAGAIAEMTRLSQPDGVVFSEAI